VAEGDGKRAEGGEVYVGEVGFGVLLLISMLAQLAKKGGEIDRTHNWRFLTTLLK
jgi:hypothetical protein